MVRFVLTTALCAALLHQSHAFSTVGRAAFVAPRQHYYSSSSSALQMNLFDRFSRVAKSNLNNILKNLEDPEKIMNQALEDMQVRSE